MTARTGNFQDLGPDVPLGNEARPRDPAGGFTGWLEEQYNRYLQTQGTRTQVDSQGGTRPASTPAPKTPQGTTPGGDTTTGGGNTTTGGGTGGGTGTTTEPPVTPPVVPAIPRADINLEGARLIDAAGRYYVEYQAYGVTLRYDLGDEARLTGLGLSALDFTSFERITQAQFNNRQGLDVGSIDERLGVAETPQATIDRDLRIFGKEDLPGWMRNSPEAMTVALQGSLEGWSEGRTYGELAKTTAFTTAFPNFAAFRDLQPGQTVLDALGSYVKSRDQIRDSMRVWRGPQADISDTTIGRLLASGWDPDQAEQVLIGEAKIRALGPGALDRINEIVAFHNPGAPALTMANLLDYVMPGETAQTPMAVQTLINDALRAQMLRTEGVLLSPELAARLGSDDETSTLDTEGFRQVAADVAGNILRFGQELSAQREGISKDDLVVALTGGDGLAEVTTKLAKFARRRQVEAQGFESRQAFVGQGGNLQLAGFGSL